MRRNVTHWALAITLGPLAFSIGCANDPPTFGTEVKPSVSSAEATENPPVLEPRPPAPIAAIEPATVLPVATVAGDTAENWAEFRGPNRDGHYAGMPPPVKWSDEQNIRWRTELPGLGTSSPIVWGENIYLTCYSGYGEDENNPGDADRLVRHLVCVNRSSGKIRWTADQQNIANVFPFQQFNALHGYASSTPVADADGVYVFYGSGGVASYTHNGDLRWKMERGNATHSWGTASSPILFENLLIILADIEGDGLLALDKSNGEPVWNVKSGNGDSWSTPLIAETDAGPELIFYHSQGDPNALIQAVDPRDGSPLWQCRALKNYLAPSPIAADGKCFAIAYDRAVAIRLGGRGDVTDSHVLWRTSKGSEICTPVYHEGHLYWAHQDSGIAYCLDANSGTVVYEERIQPRPGRIYASGVLADGNLYYTSRENGVFVVEASPTYRLVAHNQIESDRSIFNATPAITNGQILLRSNEYLYCIGSEDN